MKCDYLLITTFRRLYCAKFDERFRLADESLQRSAIGIDTVICMETGSTISNHILQRNSQQYSVIITLVAVISYVFMYQPLFDVFVYVYIVDNIWIIHGYHIPSFTLYILKELVPISDLFVLFNRCNNTSMERGITLKKSIIYYFIR